MFQALRYSRSKSNRNSPIVVAINGFSAQGYRDKRMQRAAANLACAGFEVYQPILPGIESLCLQPSSSAETGAFVLALAESRQRPVAIFSASVSASLALVACSQRPLNRHVSALFLIGPYGDVLKAVDHVMLHSADAYGRWILWLNFAERVCGPNPGLCKLFRTAIDDEGWMRQLPHLPAQLKQADPHTRALFKRFIQDPTYSELHWLEVKRQLQQDSSWVAAMDPRQHLKNLQAPLFLLHGKDDSVIPPRESQRLQVQMQQEGKHSQLLLSPLISHADLAYSWKTGIDILLLSRMFSNFFHSVHQAHSLHLEQVPERVLMHAPPTRGLSGEGGALYKMP